MVLEPFREGFFYQEGEEEGDPKNSQNGSKTIQKPKKDDNKQPKYDLAFLTPKNGLPVIITRSLEHQSPNISWHLLGIIMANVLLK